jgi:hypothetical protein
MYCVFHVTTDVNLAEPERDLASLERKPACTSRGAFHSILKQTARINVKSKLSHDPPPNLYSTTRHTSPQNKPTPTTDSLLFSPAPSCLPTHVPTATHSTRPLNPSSPAKTAKPSPTATANARKPTSKRTRRPAESKRSPKITAARDEAAAEKATKDAYAEQLAAEFLASAPSEADERPRLICDINEFGAAVTRTLDDGKKHVQPAYTYVLRYIPPAIQGEKCMYDYRDFTPAMMSAMDHMTEPEMATYHKRVEDAMVKQWVEEDGKSDVVAVEDEKERKRLERLARKFKAEEPTKCLNERS